MHESAEMKNRGICRVTANNFLVGCDSLLIQMVSYGDNSIVTKGEMLNEIAMKEDDNDIKK